MCWIISQLVNLKSPGRLTIRVTLPLIARSALVDRNECLSRDTLFSDCWFVALLSSGKTNLGACVACSEFNTLGTLGGETVVHMADTGLETI